MATSEAGRALPATIDELKELVLDPVEGLWWCLRAFGQGPIPFKVGLHDEMCRDLATHGDWFFTAPPGWFKSHVLRWYVAWRQLLDPDYTVAVVRDAGPRALETMVEFQRVFAQEDFVYVFGNRIKKQGTRAIWLSGRQWEDDNPSIVVLGRKQSLQSRHPDDLILDDILTIKNAHSPAGRAWFGPWFDQECKERPRNPRRSHLYGIKATNNFHFPDDFFVESIRALRPGEKAENGKGFFHRCHRLYPSEVRDVDDDGKEMVSSAWSERFPLTKAGKTSQLQTSLEEKRGESERSYVLQWLCDPKGATDQGIRRDLLERFWEAGELPELRKLLFRYGVDPGGTGKKISDRTTTFAMVQVAYHHEGVYVLHEWLETAVTVTGTAELIEAPYKLNQGPVTFETNNLGGYLYSELERRQVVQPYHLSWCVFQQSDDHPTRVKEIERWLETGRLFLSRHCERLNFQLRGAPRLLQHDLADALFYALRGLEMSLITARPSSTAPPRQVVAGVARPAESVVPVVGNGAVVVATPTMREWPGANLDWERLRTPDFAPFPGAF